MGSYAEMVNIPRGLRRGWPKNDIAARRPDHGAEVWRKRRLGNTSPRSGYSQRTLPVPGR